MKGRLSTIIFVIIFIIGLSLLLYPSLSDYVNQKVQSKAIVNYETVISNLNEEDYKEKFDAADAYNAALNNTPYPFMNYENVPNYDSTMNIDGSGIIGYISIDKINVELPIYHGTTDRVLNVAVGHVQGSSLPVGGESTHTVLSAHRGLPSAKLFTHLDRLEYGDTFTITVLDRVLTYEVDQIVIVTPDNVSELYVKDGEDHCTLVTCTPYGINTHRLLVRGTRIETVKPKPPIFVINEAFRIDPLIVAPIVAIPILFVLLIILLIKYRKRRS